MQAMRKVIYSCAVSLDGYISRPNGAIDFLEMPQEAEGGDSSMADFFANIDVCLMGRKSAEAAQNPGPAPQGPWTTYVMSRTRP